MKILIISSPNRHGAGILAFDLKSQLEILGHEIYLVSNFKDIDSNVIAPDITYLEKLLNRVENKALKTLKKKNPKYHFFDNSEEKERRNGKKVLNKIPRNIDLIFVLFYQGFMNFASFLKINEKYNVPFVFWMMDMAAFTGGCHYSWNCQGYMKECGNCPALFSKEEEDLSHRNLLFKKNVIKRMEVTAMVLSEYQRKQVLNSSLFSKKQVNLLRFYINLDKYSPTLNKIELSNRLKINSSKVFLFVASFIEEYRKGFSQFYNVLEKMDPVLNESITVILVGSSNNVYGKEFKTIKVIQTSNIQDRSTIIDYYRGSTFTVIPTLMDSGPLTVAESLACGTPVITYRMGVGDDVIENGKNGFICNVGDTENLMHNIKIALSIEEKEYSEMCINARKTAVKFFNRDNQLEELKIIINKVSANV